MGKFDGLLLASDFDDTLYDLELCIPERNLEAIRYFTGEGGRFVVSTGRAHRTFSPFAHMVPMNAPAVLSNPDPNRSPAKRVRLGEEEQRSE